MLSSFHSGRRQSTFKTTWLILPRLGYAFNAGAEEQLRCEGGSIIMALLQTHETRLY